LTTKQEKIIFENFYVFRKLGKTPKWLLLKERPPKLVSAREGPTCISGNSALEGAFAASRSHGPTESARIADITARGRSLRLKKDRIYADCPGCYGR
jgi:hypothetical protein